MRYTTDVRLDNETGEYYIQLSDDLLKELGWNSATDLEWIIDGDSIILKEVQNETSDESRVVNEAIKSVQLLKSSI